FSADLRYVITRPSAVVSFYLGAGYSYMAMTSTQHYSLQLDSITRGPQQIYQSSFDRGAIKVLFGARHDFEIGSGLIFEPFAQVEAIAAFQGQQQENSFIYQPDRDQLIMTN